MNAQSKRHRTFARLKGLACSQRLGNGVCSIIMVFSRSESLLYVWERRLKDWTGGYCDRSVPWAQPFFLAISHTNRWFTETNIDTPV